VWPTRGLTERQLQLLVLINNPESQAGHLLMCRQRRGPAATALSSAPSRTSGTGACSSMSCATNHGGLTSRRDTRQGRFRVTMPRELRAKAGCCKGPHQRTKPEVFVNGWNLCKEFPERSNSVAKNTHKDRHRARTYAHQKQVLVRSAAFGASQNAVLTSCRCSTQSQRRNLSH